jgi:hypothetical protein
MAYGTVNADVIGTSVAGSNIGAGNASIMKNRIINGAMVIDQRNAGASVATTTTGGYVYTLDRFAYLVSAASKFTIQQNAGSVTPPVGFTNYLGCTSTAATSVGASDYYIIRQNIEGFNTADLMWGSSDAKPICLSFWVRSSLTGTFGGSVGNGATTASYPFSYTITSANTWEQKTITIAGPTSGTWYGATNGIGMQIYFSLGMGSSLSGTAGAWTTQYYSTTGATSVVGTSGATLYLTGIQLEVGEQATGFQYENYQTSLANCQRYYQMIRSVNGSCPMVGQCYTTSSAYSGYQFVTTMRSAPTFVYSALTDWSANGANAGANALAGFSIVNANPHNAEVLLFSSASGLVAGNATVLQALNTNATFSFSAEL